MSTTPSFAWSEALSAWSSGHVVADARVSVESVGVLAGQVEVAAGVAREYRRYLAETVAYAKPEMEKRHLVDASSWSAMASDRSARLAEAASMLERLEQAVDRRRLASHRARPKATSRLEIGDDEAEVRQRLRISLGLARLRLARLERLLRPDTNA